MHYGGNRKYFILNYDDDDFSYLDQQHLSRRQNINSVVASFFFLPVLKIMFFFLLFFLSPHIRESRTVSYRRPHHSHSFTLGKSALP